MKQVYLSVVMLLIFLGISQVPAYASLSEHLDNLVHFDMSDYSYDQADPGHDDGLALRESVCRLCPPRTGRYAGAPKSVHKPLIPVFREERPPRT